MRLWNGQWALPPPWPAQAPSRTLLPLRALRQPTHAAKEDRLDFGSAYPGQVSALPLESGPDLTGSPGRCARMTWSRSCGPVIQQPATYVLFPSIPLAGSALELQSSRLAAAPLSAACDALRPPCVDLPSGHKIQHNNGAGGWLLPTVSHQVVILGGGGLIVRRNLH